MSSIPATQSESSFELKSSTVLFMAVSVGLIVANIYYVQPLLGHLADAFHISAGAAGAVAMATQFGSALGMMFLVPLGDSTERRSLITRLVLLEAICLVLAAVSPSVVAFGLASIGIGIATSCVHIFLPFAAHLAKPAERGKVVGTVLSGLLLGILLARTISGNLGDAFGWRSVYAVAAVLMLILLSLIRVLLPRDQPTLETTYRELLQSVIAYAKEHQPLREAAFTGACFFCAFSAFWTTLVFLLQTPPYHFSSKIVGDFGLIGAAGAVGALVVGRLADRHSPRRLVAIAVFIVFASFIELLFFGRSLVGLIVGVIVMDFGVQAGHVSNQSRIYAINPAARSRLNTVYMVSYFAGGSLGSLISGYCWEYAGWTGVCLLALTAMTLSAGYLVKLSLKRN